jgi:NDP-sugar pyrophosphorylase family protein
MTLALIMAGGRSARMRATAGGTHKALQPVLGVPLIERNVRPLLAAGFHELFVATSHAEPAIVNYVNTRCRDLVSDVGGSIECIIETKPLGTIGAAGLLARRRCGVLVVNVDNLTTLDLTRFVAHHEISQAALTVAVHIEKFQVPFGQVVCEEGQIKEYAEKPSLPVCISSGTYVLSPRACQHVARSRRKDIPELIADLHGQGEEVAAYHHDSAWIDVNDRAALQKAELLIGGQEMERERCLSKTHMAKSVSRKSHIIPCGDA